MPARGKDSKKRADVQPLNRTENFPVTGLEKAGRMGRRGSSIKVRNLFNI
jgi:hypothetical protein